MAAKLLSLVHSKVALAVLGVLLVGGSGAAVVAANHSQNSSNSSNDHAHSVSLNGRLTAYDAAGKTISVQSQDASSPTTISVDANTRVNGEHATSLADLSQNIGHDVEVHADKQSNGTLLAWKVTVQGNDSSNKNGQGGDNGQQHQIGGTIATVGTGSFTVKLPDGTTKTVTVSSSTEFAGAAHRFKDLKVGMQVSVQGTDQSDGTFAATQIEAGGKD